MKWVSTLNFERRFAKNTLVIKMSPHPQGWIDKNGTDISPTGRSRNEDTIRLLCHKVFDKLLLDIIKLQPPLEQFIIQMLT